MAGGRDPRMRLTHQHLRDAAFDLRHCVHHCCLKPVAEARTVAVVQALRALFGVALVTSHRLLLHHLVQHLLAHLLRELVR